ncbi:sensor histidine kinase [Pseudohoeflea coraliihabitans]|uniref:GAF domain-containing protein n=1 Tax=Pseudohoeflea coraliihabitans TaxID=2860393 RepID=A0ABS6WNB6_9HYPH|nr:histidine kinase dimerization/phosphoacceptor domain -containing protein [Pseudohoeflea sp. DP4N28-3]MBW3096569.1 GAF domain-containing protein [Pseudohoeflea sp. DP4N28-3]
MRAEPHPREDDRLSRLDAYRILDTVPETEYDELVELASRITGTPVSLVSLIDRDRQWFKARKGFADSQTTLENSICAHGLSEDGIFEIPDTRLDPRTADMDIVTAKEDPVRFYAGAPLMTEDGLSLGMLCVLDHNPRQLTEDQRFALKVLSRQVMAQLELRRRLQESEDLSARLETALAGRDLLAREIDHRVKNSLAMVTSFLTMQKRRTQHEEARSELEAAAQRVAAISHLHHEFYSAAVDGEVALPEFAERLTSLLGETAPQNISLEVDMAPIRVEAQKASAFAIIANEFVANAFKHAFPGGEPGRILLSGRREGDRYHLAMRDNGIGSQKEAVAAGPDAADRPPRPRGLGQRIILSVGRQLGGQPHLRATPEGYRFEIDFPAPEAAT